MADHDSRLPPPVPSHRSLQVKPGTSVEQLHTPIHMKDTRETGQVSIAMDDSQSVPESDNEESQFSMSFEYDATFRAHKAASVTDGYENILKMVYNYTLFGVYNFVVFTTGLCLVLFWGIVNGFTIYCQSWCLSPIVRFCLVILHGGCLPLYEILKSLMKSMNELCGSLTLGCCKKR